MEAASNRLQKEAKGYLDSLRGAWSSPGPRCDATQTADRTGTAMTASQMRIAETIDAFYGDAGAKDGVSRSYKQAVEDLDAETIKALDGPYRYASLGAPHVPAWLTKRNLLPEQRCSSPYPDSATTFPTSTNVGHRFRWATGDGRRTKG